MPAALNRGSVRDSFPNVNAAGWANAAVLNHWPSRAWAEPSTAVFGFTTLGRDPPPKEFVRLVAVVKARGRPVWNVETPVTPQPDRTLSPTPWTFPKIRL